MKWHSSNENNNKLGTRTGGPLRRCLLLPISAALYWDVSRVKEEKQLLSGLCALPRRLSTTNPALPPTGYDPKSSQNVDQDLLMGGSRRSSVKLPFHSEATWKEVTEAAAVAFIQFRTSTIHNFWVWSDFSQRVPVLASMLRQNSWGTVNNSSWHCSLGCHFADGSGWWTLELSQNNRVEKRPEQARLCMHFRDHQYLSLLSALPYTWIRKLTSLMALC